MPALRAPSRRRLLRMVLLGGVASGVAACAASQTGSVTNVTIDVTRLVTDGRAITTALQTALAIPGVAVLLGANLSAAETALAVAVATMGEIAALTGGAVTLSIDTSKVRSLVLSMLNDVRTVLALVRTLPTAAAPALPSDVMLMMAATVTLMPLVQVAAGLSSGPPRSAPMSEAEALRIATGA